MLNDSSRTKARRGTLVAAALFICVAFPAGADDQWSFSLGGGAFVSNVYCGADEFYIAPLPVARAAYKTGKLEFSASLLDGLGFQYFDMDRHLIATIGVNMGGERDSEEYRAVILPVEHSRSTKRFLAGSPTVSNPVYASVLLGWISPVGILGASLSYQATIVEGDDKDFYNAFVPSLVYLAPVPLTDKLMVTGMLTLEFMDRNYAESWYSVKAATAELEEFEAEAGLRDVQLILQVEYRFMKHLALNLLAGNMYLLKDAADSPYTRSPYQLTSGLYLTYLF